MESFYPGVWLSPAASYEQTNPVIADRRMMLEDPNYGLYGSDFRDYVYQQATGALDKAHSGVLGVAKAKVIGDVLNTFGAGRARLPWESVTKMPMSSRMAKGLGQVATDIYYQMDRSRFGREAVAFSKKTSTGRTFIGSPGGSLRMVEKGKVFRDPILGPNGPKSRSGFGKIMDMAIPRGTGLRSMLFWNFATGAYKDNFDSTAGVLGQWAKYYVASNVINMGTAMIQPTLRRGVGKLFGDKWRKTIAGGGFGEAMEGTVGKGVATTMRSTTIGELNAGLRKHTFRSTLEHAVEGQWSEALRGSASLVSRWGQVGATAFGTALRAINWIGGVSSVHSIAQSYSDYRNNIRMTMMKEASAFDTAYSAMPEFGAAVSERQRAIEGIQNAGMSLRNYFGNEASMMHH